MVNIWMQTNIRLYHPYFFFNLYVFITQTIHTCISVIILAYYPPPKAKGYCFGVVRPSGTLVSGAISWKCFGGFHWNLVWVYIQIRGWCTPNGILYHLLITELWPFVYILCQCSMWGYTSRLWQSSSLAGDINSTNLLVYMSVYVWASLWENWA